MHMEHPNIVQILGLLRKISDGHFDFHETHEEVGYKCMCMLISQCPFFIGLFAVYIIASTIL